MCTLLWVADVHGMEYLGFSTLVLTKGMGNADSIANQYHEMQKQLLDPSPRLPAHPPGEFLILGEDPSPQHSLVSPGKAQ